MLLGKRLLPSIANSTQILKAERRYEEEPDNESLRELLIASAKYCFVNDKSLIEGQALFKKLPINHEANQWSFKHCNPKDYQATWLPKKTPTLILAGSADHITPISLFKNNKLYQRENILLAEISHAGHYPWFENPQEVIMAFQHFCQFFNFRKRE